jgi:general nucleoside transport system permease protein
VSVLESVISTTMLAQTLRMSVPYVCAALGGVWSERSGIVNIALEGTLLASGLAAVVFHLAAHSPWLGALGAVAFGALVAFVHALLVARARVDAMVSGIALNLVAAGGTRFALRSLYDSSSNSPAVEGFRLVNRASSSGGALLARTALDPLTLATVLAAVASLAWLYGSRFGLHVRACGEGPQAAASAGVSVVRVRIAAVAIGGAICGLGGAALAFDQHQFQSGMSGGRGFIALAAVIVSGWRPIRAVLACAVFAALEALQIVLQDQTRLPREIVVMFPYVATLVALVVIGLHRDAIAGRPPAGLGKHPDAV